MSDLEERLWLVKSGGRILGPYSIRKIKELLRTKELVPIDEACPPLGRWHHLRELPQLEEIIDELKTRELRREENTETVGQLIDDEMTASVTTTLTSLSSDDLTEEIGSFDGDLTQDILEGDSPREVNAVEVIHDKTPAKRFGTVDSAKAETGLFSKLLWAAVASTALVAGGFVFYYKYQTDPIVKGIFEKNEDVKKRAFELYQIGKYSEALDEFKRLYENHNNDKELNLYYASLLIKVEDQTVLGKRLLSESMEEGSANQKYVLAALGLANMLDGEFSQARQYFVKALKMDPNFTTAVVNLSTIENHEGKFEKAKQRLQSAIIKGGEDNSAYIFLAKNYIDQYKASGDGKLLNKAKEILYSFVDKNFDYKQEANFLISYILYLQGGGPELQTYMTKTLNTDPMLTSLHKHDLLIYDKPIQWKSFLPWCTEIFDSNKKDSLSAALSAYCHVKSGDLKQAEIQIQTALEYRKRHPLFQAINSYILNELGQNNAASVALGRAIEFNRNNFNFELPFIMQAWFCQKAEDWSCAQDNWNKVISLNKNHLQAIVNASLVRAHTNNFIGTKGNILKGYSLSKNYIPLMELNELNENQTGN